MIQALLKYTAIATAAAAIMLYSAFLAPVDTPDAHVIHLAILVFCGSVFGMWVSLLLLKLTAPPIGNGRAVLLQSKMLDSGVIPVGTVGCLRWDYIMGGTLFQTDAGQVVEVKSHEVARL